MIWIQHDFYSNFVNSIGSTDTDLTISIFVSEITDLIAHKSNKLFDLFESLGIKISKKSSDEELVDKILSTIQVSNKFLVGLAFLMVENNDVISQNKGETPASIIYKVSGCIRKIAVSIKENPQLGRSLKKDIMTMDALKVSTDGARSGFDGSENPRPLYKKDRTVLYLVLGVAAAFGAYYLYKYFKDKKQKELLAGGGAISAGDSTVIDQTPPAQAVSTSVEPVVVSAQPAAPVVAQPMRMPDADTYIRPVAEPVVVAQTVQPAVAQSVNVNAQPNA